MTLFTLVFKMWLTSAKSEREQPLRRIVIGLLKPLGEDTFDDTSVKQIWRSSGDRLLTEVTKAAKNTSGQLHTFDTRQT